MDALKGGAFMAYVLLATVTLFTAYYTFIVWAHPERVRQYLRNFYNDSWVRDVVSSTPAFWFVRVFVSVLFAICFALLISGIMAAFKP